MTMQLEDRLWQELEAAAERESARGRAARGSAAARAALPASALRAACGLLAAAALVALAVALVPDRARPQWRADRFTVPGAHIGAAVAGHGALWSYDRQSGRLLRIDPRTHRVTARTPLTAPGGEVSLASSADALWAVPSSPIRHSAPAPPHPPASEALRLDPRSGAVEARVALRAPDGMTIRPVEIVARPGAVWVWGEGGALRVDPRRDRVTAAVTPRGERALGFAATASRLSFFTDLGRLATYDARTGERLGTVPVDGPLAGEDLVAVGTHVLVYRQGGELALVDPIDGRDAWTARLGGRPRDVAISGGRLWLLTTGPAGGGELQALDAGDGRAVARVALPGDDARGLVPAGTVPFVTTQDGGLIALRPPPG